MEPPVFAVVGHVNKGKSSIVAALAEDDSVPIARQARTTRANQIFPLRVDSRTLFTLIDTPGFEQARHALAWMRERETSAAERSNIVAEFVRQHEQTGEFPEERELLRPILDGAGILYVVDGSRPFSPRYEAEMEILRWTGRPRMAMINRIGERDHVEEWRQALDQYFSLVRPFNAHAADFQIRLQLLYGFRELREEWRPFVDEAIHALEAERERRRRRSARAIADMVGDQLALTLDKRVPDEVDLAPFRRQLEEQYREALRQRERKERDEVEDLYQHRRLRRQESELSLVTDDLFDETVWLRLGLTRKQLAATGLLGGVLVGGGIDLAAGGATFLTGALIGGAIGGVSGWLGTRSLAKISIQGLRLGGRLLRIGPMRNPQFAWIALDRALLHYALVSQRSHARRDELVLEPDGKQQGRTSQLPLSERREIEAALTRVRKEKDPDFQDDAREDLAGKIEGLLERAVSGKG
ncbi:GTPase/DUF3482 domain-containing protein [bacterium]|nr:GTPase/DUF3482 domain-containing protein [bacterium]